MDPNSLLSLSDHLEVMSKDSDPSEFFQRLAD